MIIEISTHGSTLRRNHDSFVVWTKEDKTEIPAEKVESVIISSNALVSSQAVKLAMEKQIQIVFSNFSGKPFARIWASTPGKSTEIRRWQYMNQDTDEGLKISYDIVIRKLKNQKKLLYELKNNRSKDYPVLVNAIPIFEQTLEQIHGKNFPKDKLLGFEGWCAKNYFLAISSILPKKWQFESRSQHPAKDEFNAVLNYIYGIGYSDVEKIIILSGLDPNAGFYHSDAYGKPTLSYDLIELVRPMMDKITISLFTKRQVKSSWFESHEDIIFLTKDGRKNIIKKYVEKNKADIQKQIWSYCRKIISMSGNGVN